MAISLAKGANVNLAKEAPGVFKFRIGLGWDARATDGEKVHASGAITYNGDNRTGEGEGDDETISIDTSKMPADIQKVAFTCTIDMAVERRQNFGMVNNAYIRIVDENTDTEIARFDLSEDFSVETAMIFGELYLHNGEWKFKAIGQGFSAGLAGLCGNFGVDAA